MFLSYFVLFQNHLVEMDSDDLPDSLVGKKDELFSNIKDIYTFHTRFDALIDCCIGQWLVASFLSTLLPLGNNVSSYLHLKNMIRKHCFLVGLPL